MKKLIIISILSGWSIVTCTAQSTSQPDSLGLPGDNLNLYAVMDLFQKSETFEIFEQKLNDEKTKINNLDLNNDDKIDYIRVIDNKDGDNHAIVLQVPINDKETQDVAVIELEKDKTGNYQLQIVGNEDLYGKDYIIEPAPEKAATTATKPKVKTSASSNSTTNVTIINNYTYYDPNPYPIITYVYRPAYVVYVSPWYWGYYPVVWRPWRPWYYRSYYNYHYHHYGYYHNHYHRAAVYRSPVVHKYYGPRVNSSAVVRQNNSQGTYRKNYQTSPSRGRSNPGFRSNSGRTNTGGSNNSGRTRNNNPSFNNNGSGNTGTRSRNNVQQDNNQSGNSNNNGSNNQGRSRTRSENPAYRQNAQQNNNNPAGGNNNPTRTRTRTDQSGGGRQTTQNNNQNNRQNTMRPSNSQQRPSGGGGGGRQQSGGGGGHSGGRQGGGGGGNHGGGRGR